MAADFSEELQQGGGGEVEAAVQVWQDLHQAQREEGPHTGTVWTGGTTEGGGNSVLPVRPLGHQAGTQAVPGTMNTGDLRLPRYQRDVYWCVRITSHIVSQPHTFYTELTTSIHRSLMKHPLRLIKIVQLIDNVYWINYGFYSICKYFIIISPKIILPLWCFDEAKLQRSLLEHQQYWSPLVAT